MRIRRILFRTLALVGACAGILFVLALAPMVQTWAAQTLLARRPSWQASLGWISARFGRVELTDLHLNLDGALLTVPTADARIPLTTAIARRRLLIRRLVAKGWKLDLSHRSPAGAAVPPPTTGAGPAPSRPPAEAVGDTVGVFLGLLHRWSFPCEVALDGVDLEGDVLVPSPAGGAPAPLHFVIKGGGMAAGAVGRFTAEITGDVLDANDQVTSFDGHSRLQISMNTPRAIDRIETKTDLSANGGFFPNGIQLSVAASDAAGRDGDTYSVAVARGGRPVAAVAARYNGAARRLSGTWSTEIENSDLALCAPGQTLPVFVAKGHGTFDTDIALAAWRAEGRLEGTVSGLDSVSTYLAPVESATVAADFEVARDGNSLQCARLSVAASHGGATVTVKTLQPLVYGGSSGVLQPVRPTDDWLDIAWRGVPPEWLAGFGGVLTWSKGTVAGDVAMRKVGGGYALRSVKPLVATGVSLVRAGRIIGRNLDLTSSLVADYGSDGWKLEAAPGRVDSGGESLGEFHVTALHPPGSDQPVTVKAAWSADLQAHNLRAAIPDLRDIGGKSVSGDVTATVGPTTDWDAKITAVGRDPHRTLNATMHASVDDSGRFSFQGPVKWTDAASTSDLTVDGTVIPGADETAVYLKLDGKAADLDQLRRLAGSVAAIEGIPLAKVIAGGQGGTGRDRTPFWGNWSGRLLATFGRLTAGGVVFQNVGCALQVGPRSIHLEEGRGSMAGHRLAQLVGSISFDPAAPVPYELKASASVEPFEVASYFPAAHPDDSPTIEGQFSAAGSVTGEGINWEDLIARTRETVRFASSAGIVRVFKTDVDEAIPPDTESAVADTMGRMGTAVGRFFGVEDADRTARKKVGPALQAALNVINSMSEIGYDQVNFTAERGADRAIRLKDLVMVAGDLRVTGSGTIRCPEGLPLAKCPLQLDLQIGARDHDAKLLAAAGLLGAQKDARGYLLLREPVTLGGTMARPDNREWHQLLVKAAGGPVKIQSR